MAKQIRVTRCQDCPFATYYSVGKNYICSADGRKRIGIVDGPNALRDLDLKEITPPSFCPLLKSTINVYIKKSDKK